QVPACRGDAVRKSQGHARVISPLPGLQAVWPAISIASDGGEAPWGFEFDSCPQRIAHGQTDQCSPATIFHDVFPPWAACGSALLRPPPSLGCTTSPVDR